MAKETILSLEAEFNESPRDAPEGNWVLSGGIEIPCTYKEYGRIDQISSLRKNVKGTKQFFKIHCSFLYFAQI